MFDIITRCYEKIRLMNYRSLFHSVQERDGSLSATEAFAVDLIYLLDDPTVKEFADSIGISQSNATYKVNNLIQKGYIRKVPSDTDHREFHLHVTEKFLNYCHEGNERLLAAGNALKQKFSGQELKTFYTMLQELMHLLT